MRVIQTEGFKKRAASWDDQPGFVNRDRHPGGLSQRPRDPSEEEIMEYFEQDPKKRKRRKKELKKRIYQLGIDVPVMQRDIKKNLISL